MKWLTTLLSSCSQQTIITDSKRQVVISCTHWHFRTRRKFRNILERDRLVEVVPVWEEMVAKQLFALVCLRGGDNGGRERCLIAAVQHLLGLPSFHIQQEAEAVVRLSGGCWEASSIRAKISRSLSSRRLILHPFMVLQRQRAFTVGSLENIACRLNIVN